jgi:UbiD family decarboxylase
MNMQKDMRTCLEAFESAGCLLTVDRQTDPKFEIPAVMKQAEKIGQAVHFRNVKNSKFSVVNNVFGSRQMLGLLFETKPEKVVNEWIERSRTPIEPVTVESGPVKKVVKKGDEVDLGDFPIVTHCSKDAGPFITAG